MKRFGKIFRGGMYRSRHGIILGVCRGIAEYFDFSVFWVRAIVVILFILTGFWPVVGLYILAALLMKSDPAMRTETQQQRCFNSRQACARNGTADRLRRKWQHLEKRIRKMVDKITSREFDWNHRFRG